MEIKNRWKIDKNEGMKDGIKNRENEGIKDGKK